MSKRKYAQAPAISRYRRLFRLLVPIVVAVATVAQSHAQAGAEGPYFARRNSFGIFGAYSGDSSHILLGEAENRRLVEIGASYSRRILLNRRLNWQYDGEIIPVVLESDPTSIFFENQTNPTASTYNYNSGPTVSCATVTTPYAYTDPVNGVTYSGTITISCQGRRWVVGEAMSPGGFQFNFLPQRRVQPLLSTHAGFMYSSQTIPIAGAGSFNFTFDVGAGLELYRSKTKSIRAEYRYHHISNGDTASVNPGIDNGEFQVTYCFGH